MTERLLNAREVAECLSLSPETVLSWVRAEKLPAFRLPNGAIRFRHADLESWLRERSTIRKPVTGLGEDR